VCSCKQQGSTRRHEQRLTCNSSKASGCGLASGFSASTWSCVRRGDGYGSFSRTRCAMAASSPAVVPRLGAAQLHGGKWQAAGSRAWPDRAAAGVQQQQGSIGGHNSLKMLSAVGNKQGIVNSRKALRAYSAEAGSLQQQARQGTRQ
jgi:hypothetical protein